METIISMPDILETFGGMLFGGALAASVLAFFNYQASRRMYQRGEEFFEESKRQFAKSLEHCDETRRLLSEVRQAHAAQKASFELSKRLN